MIRAALCAAAVLVAGQAAALSCIRPDLARSFNEAAASDKTYVVLFGTFDFNLRDLPQVDWDRQQDVQPDNPIRARFTGDSLSRKGFVPSSIRRVTINAQCFGPWCSSIATDTPYLAFVEKNGNAYTLAVSPCGGRAFGNPGQAQLDLVTTCFQGGPCLEETPLR